MFTLATARLELVPAHSGLSPDYSPYVQERKHIVRHLAKVKADPDELGWGVWLVVDRAANEVVGDIGFKGKPAEARTVEAGFGFLPAARNQGFATESVRALMEWAFATGRVDAVTAECLVDNQASARVLEKLGMTRTGSNAEMVYWALAAPTGNPAAT
ncbi:ribosomal-protein-alanine N-acetyltransferase [Paenibacillus sp. UNC496MF]|nr:ribosomal-protein-alanine N-acetyltransferase [Paenibacillus sp. UNC496MF]